MSDIVVKRQLMLDFLGKDYSESFLTMRCLSVDDFESLKTSDKTVREVVVENFIDGKIQQDKDTVAITKENINQLPAEVFKVAFDLITGNLDPKSEGLSTMPSTTNS